jgi:DNA-binding transcriptional LysR family regulator
MHRLRRIAKAWDGLPAFRAVAETENMHRAAEKLKTSPSALSRSLKQLEREVGLPLFHRAGRSLKLTELGQELLTATRLAMRNVEDVINVDGARPLDGSLRVSSAGRLTMVYLLAALRRVRRAHPEITPHVVGAPVSDVESGLLRGDLDLALVFEPTPGKDLVVTRLGDATNGIYCGKGHALHGQTTVTLEDVLAHPFAAPEPRPNSVSVDGWPRHLRRTVALYSSLLDPGMVLCGAGELLAVFPDALAMSSLAPAGLHRLPLDVIPPTAIYAVTRARVGKRMTRAEVLLAELRHELASAASLFRASRQRACGSSSLHGECRVPTRADLEDASRQARIVRGAEDR